MARSIRKRRAPEPVVGSGDVASPHFIEPMEARLVEDLPQGEGWQFEPKWDGFRCLAFRADDEVELLAKSGKPLGAILSRDRRNLSPPSR